MSDTYVPGTDTVRLVYVGAPKLQNEPDGYRAGREAAFDRWLAAERAAAKAEALDEVCRGIAGRLDHDPCNADPTDSYINVGLRLAIREVKEHIGGRSCECC